MKKTFRLNRVLNNTSWIIGCKIVQALLSFVIGTLTARYLGPSNYGLINYAASLVAFALPIMQLGFNEILVNDFLEYPQKSGKIMGTSLVLNIFAAVTSIIGLCAFALVTNEGDIETTLICFLYSLTLIFQAAEMTVYWFQANLLSKYTSIISLFAHFIGAIYKAYLLITGKSVVWFALTHVIESCIISLALLFLFIKHSGQKLQFCWQCGMRMLARSKYYISSALMIVVFQQTDRIMLKVMMSAEEVGFYSSSLACLSITGFVFSAIIDSARPWVLEGKQYSNTELANRLKAVLSIVIYISLAQSIVMIILAKPIIGILFGERYLPAANVLRIAVWYVSFGYMGTIRNIWILANSKQRYLPLINFSGAVLNVVMNYMLIPVYGAVGAAMASLMTQFFANFLLCLIVKPIRETGILMLESVNPRIILRLLKEFISDKR